MYRSYLASWNEERGPYREVDAAVDFERYLLATTTDHFRQLTYPEKKTIHNLKYFTWVEQQHKTAEDLQALWRPTFWRNQIARIEGWDEAIREFNREAGVLAAMKREQGHE
jgi:cysteine synthase A